MKKNIIFSIIFIALSLFLFFFGLSAYKYYRALHVDAPIDPYLLVDIGTASIVRGDLTIHLDASEKYNLLENDTIITRENSEGTVFWPDRSTTHLGANSALTIHTMKVAADYMSIHLEMSLTQGKMYSNIVRTLYPWSKINVHIPNQWVIAGVRGTEFAVNLEKGYIHSVDHVVTLRNGLFQTVALLPGQAVSVADIFKQISMELIDHVWQDAVSLKSAAYSAEHAEMVKNSWNILVGELKANDYWDSFVRWVLSKFSLFKEIELARHIENDAHNLITFSQNELLKIYQKIKMTDLAAERDAIRGALYQFSSNDKNLQKILETIAMESLWDKIDFPNLTLENTDKILQDFSRKMTIDIDSLIKNIQQKDYTKTLPDTVKNWFSLE